jgi:hypothetical protein
MDVQSDVKAAAESDHSLRVKEPIQDKMVDIGPKASSGTCDRSKATKRNGNPLNWSRPEVAHAIEHAPLRENVNWTV